MQLQIGIVHCTALARAIWDAKVVKERERVKKKLYLFTFLAWAKDYDENGRILMLERREKISLNIQGICQLKPGTFINRKYL